MSLRTGSNYIMDRWLDDSRARISVAEIRAHLEQSASPLGKQHLEAEMERLITVLNGCDGIEVSHREVMVKANHHSRLRKLFQNLDDIVDGITTPERPLVSEISRLTPHEAPPGRTSVLDELDQDLASQRSKPGRARL